MNRPFAAELDLRDAPQALRDRFWSKVAIGNPDECWEWKEHRKASGYGQFVLRKGVFVTASRAALALSIGVVPAGHVACHSCDNPPCCNPKHLFAGSQSVNALDSVSKGRAIRAQGEAVPWSKLTVEQVREIRSAPPVHGFMSRLAREYAVSPSTIRAIVRGTKWRCVA